MKKERILVVLGPTASGKSSLAVKLAREFNGEVISADSRQIYRELNIGSNKITLEEREGVPHHLLDIARPDQKVNLFDWREKALKIIDDLHSKGKLPIIAGGTGLYIASIVQNYQLDSSTTAECTYDYMILGIDPPRDQLYEKINQRVLEMLDEGLLDEVRVLHTKYPEVDLNALSGIGYKELYEHLEGNTTLEQAVESIQQNTRHYAKRQMTWFRKMEKEGVKINWNLEDPIAEVKKFLN